MPPCAAGGVGPAEALERVADELVREAGPLVGHVELDRVVAVRRAQSRTCPRRGRARCRPGSSAPARRAGGRPATARVGPSPRVSERAAARPRAGEARSDRRRAASSDCEAARAESAARRPRSARRPGGPRRAAISRSISSIAEAIAARSSASSVAVAQGELELGLVEGERGPQLVAGVVDEAALALERRPRAGRASRSGSRRAARSSSSASGTGQPLAGFDGRDLARRGCASPRPGAAPRPATQ